MRLAFMGTPDFAVPSLAELIASGHEIVAVYSQPPRAAGRRGLELTPSPVQRAKPTSRGTRGKAGTRSQGEEAVKLFISCNDHDSLLLFSDRGVVYSVPAYRVPVSSRAAKGTPVVQLLQLLKPTCGFPTPSNFLLA